MDRKQALRLSGFYLPTGQKLHNRPVFVKAGGFGNMHAKARAETGDVMRSSLHRAPILAANRSSCSTVIATTEAFLRAGVLGFSNGRYDRWNCSIAALSRSLWLHCARRLTSPAANKVPPTLSATLSTHVVIAVFARVCADTRRAALPHSFRRVHSLAATGAGWIKVESFVVRHDPATAPEKGRAEPPEGSRLDHCAVSRGATDNSRCDSRL